MVVFEVTPEMAGALNSAHLDHHCVSHTSCNPAVRTVHHAVLLDAVRATAGGAGVDAALLDLARRGAVHRTHADAAAAHVPPPQRSPALEARLTLLRAQAEERAYAQMVRDVSASTASSAQLESARMGRIGAQASIGVNVIVTMITCFVAGYFAFKHSSGRESVGLAGGVVCMIIAMAVEATLVITRMYSIESAAEKDETRRTRRLAANQRGGTPGL
jgi:uncharacterized membrane protein